MKRGYLMCIKENTGDYEIKRVNETVTLKHAKGSFWSPTYAGKKAVTLECVGGADFIACFYSSTGSIMKEVRLDISQLAELIQAARVYDQFHKQRGKIFTSYRLLKEYK